MMSDQIVSDPGNMIFFILEWTNAQLLKLSYKQNQISSESSFPYRSYVTSHIVE